MVTTKLNLSMTEPQVRQIYAKQGDTGRVLDITLDQTPEDGTLRILRPDGTEVTSEAVTGGEVSESGETVTFESMTEADVTELSVGIEPVQDLNGYDAPWVGGAGKNLFDKDNPNTVNGYISTSGLVQSNPDNRTVYVKVTPNSSVTVTFTQVALSTSTARDDVQAGVFSSVPIGGATGTYKGTWSRASATEDYTYSFSISVEDNDYVAVKIGNTARTDVTASLETLQIEYGTSATSYSPYSNICPITGHDEVTVTDVGKNRALFSNESNPNRSAFDYTTETAQKISGTCTAGGGRFIGRYIVHLKANTNYKAVGSASWGRGVICIYSDELWGTIVAPNVQFGNSFSVSNEGDYVVGAYVGVATVGTTYTLTDFMIVLASETDTAYEPYRSNAYTTSLGQTVYGGTLDLVSGVLTVDSRYLTVNDFTFMSSGTSAGGLYWVNVPQTYPTGVNDNSDTNVCSHAPYTSSGDVGWGSTTPIYTVNSSGYPARIYVDSTTYADFQTKYATLQAVYKLAEPVTYQLTPQQIKTLVGTNNVWASSGDIVSIKFTYGGLLSELPSEATEIVGKCYCDVEQNGVSSMPFTLNVKKNERES